MASYLEAIEALTSDRRMTQFLVTKKDGEKVVIGFIDLHAFLAWLRAQHKVIIEVAEDKDEPMKIEVSHG